MKYLSPDTSFFCVEDDDQMRKDVVNCLRSMGFTGQILTASNGKEAIELVEQSADKIADIIISDMVMPELTGCEFVEKLRKIEIYKDTPVLMLTSISTREVILDCINAGANNYVVKPVEPNLLATKLVKVWHNLK